MYKSFLCPLLHFIRIFVLDSYIRSGLNEFNDGHAGGITLARVELHDAYIAALPSIETDTEIAQELLHRDRRNHPLQFPEYRDTALRLASPDFRLVDDLVDEILDFFGFRLGRRDALIENQAPQESFEKRPALIASAAQYAAGVSV